MTELALSTVEACANWGRWIARCGWCGAGYGLTRLEPGFNCVECGFSNDVAWPSGEFCASVERILLMRPNPKNQNWTPGETLADLLQENVEHGIIALHATRGIPFTFATVGDRIVRDTLPSLNKRRELR